MKAKKRCPDCGSYDIGKNGFRITSIKGKRRRYICRDCGRTFY